MDEAVILRDLRGRVESSALEDTHGIHSSSSAAYQSLAAMEDRGPTGTRTINRKQATSCGKNRCFERANIRRAMSPAG